jgi:hypothetical protein
VLDDSLSFRYSGEVVQTIKGSVRALGPTDEFYLVRLAGADFDRAGVHEIITQRPRSAGPRSDRPH